LSGSFILNKYVCIHGHFYQPPRENPWLDEVEVQDSAFPYHDWNERVTAESYARNGAARILGADKMIIDIVNNYSKISFNFGATLLSWMQKKSPDVYEAILEADQVSQAKFSGHGAALAQVYNHLIMPWANSRDKRTQVAWGIRDFEFRFRRKPEGMWLAETAVDYESLDLMAEMGIKFTILAPRQAKRVRELKAGSAWIDVADKVDPRMPYLCRLPSGRSITIFFYDGPISQGVAFEGLLMNGEFFAGRLMSAFTPTGPQNQLVHIATDGETYGHHHKFGDMALAFCLNVIETRKDAKLTIYGEFLEKFPPTHEAEIFEKSSWSCVHGIDRWGSDCGCSSGMNQGWKQTWREPLRQALDWLRDELISIYEQEMKIFTPQVWELRDGYIDVILDRRQERIEEFFQKNLGRRLSDDEKIRALKLLEMQYNAQLMYTSCGWFFDDISGIETVQIMKYAARAIQLAKEVCGADLEQAFVQFLENAPSNVPEMKNGAFVYRTMIQPSVVDLLRVAAHYAMTSLYEEYPEEAKMYCYTVKTDTYDLKEAGRLRLAIGGGIVQSDITLEKSHINFAVLHLGDHNFIGGVNPLKAEEFLDARKKIIDAFLQSNIPDVISVINKYFGPQSYSLWHLFKEEQQKILNMVLQSTMEDIDSSFRQIYEHHYPLMQIKNEIRLPLPRTLMTVVEFILNRDLGEILEQENINIEKLQTIVDEMKRWAFKRDQGSFSFVASQKISDLMMRLTAQPKNIGLIETIEAVLNTLTQLSLDLDLWKSQNIYFAIGKQYYAERRHQAKTDELARKWIKAFDRLGVILQVRIV
jgi:alpha-amylase/alpha-mannosidase (GH57 family)